MRERACSRFAVPEIAVSSSEILICLVDEDSVAKGLLSGAFSNIKDIRLVLMSPSHIIRTQHTHNYNLVIIDLDDDKLISPGLGLRYAGALKKSAPETPVMVISSDLTVETFLYAKQELKVNDAFHKILFFVDGFDWFNAHIRDVYTEKPNG